MTRRNHISRVNLHTGGLSDVEEIPSEVVVGVIVFLLYSCGLGRRGGGYAGEVFSGCGEEGEGEGCAVVGEGRLYEAGAVEVGVICHLGVGF